MGVWVAPSFPISLAAKFGSGSSDGSSRFTATQLLCFGAMDGLSSKFANRIPRECQLWSNDRLLAVRKRQIEVSREPATSRKSITDPGTKSVPFACKGCAVVAGGAELGVSEVLSEEEMPRAVPLLDDALGVDRLVR